MRMIKDQSIDEIDEKYAKKSSKTLKDFQLRCLDMNQAESEQFDKYLGRGSRV